VTIPSGPGWGMDLNPRWLETAAYQLIQSVLRCVSPPAAPVNPAMSEIESVASIGESGWTPIDGIDSDAAHMRFGDDVELFRRLLRRLLKEFADEVLHESDAGSDYVSLAARMHKLKGCAGTLGATAINLLATRIEHACAAGDIGEIERLAALLGLQLSRLRHGVALTLGAARVESDAWVSDLALSPEGLVNLAQYMDSPCIASGVFTFWNRNRTA
jgi:HPt (histidine-containing phosphotransfer) domain-containing protein